MKKILSALLLSTMAISGFAQDVINFEEQNHKAVSVYDYWENSPFRTGQLEGQFEIIDNPAKEEGTNNSDKVLSFTRSRYGSHLYGARIDLKEPIQLSSTPSYFHVLIKTPNKGNVALIGLGKRDDWANQSPETFQLVRLSTKEIPAGKWADAVFKVVGNKAAQIHSIVIIPDTKSMLPTDQDYVAYIDEIVHNNEPLDRFSTESYPLLFEKDAVYTRRDRKLNGVTFEGNQGASISIDISSSNTVYNDKLDQAIAVVPGETLTPSFNFKGEWMHRYVYFDKGNDGKFTPEIQNNMPTANSDLVAYSFLSENNAKNGYDSTGKSVQDGTLANPPAFTIPSDLEYGFYRIRCKVDWNSDNAGGNPAQSIIDNGGGIIDFLANVHGESVSLSMTARMCDVTAIGGGKLPTEIPFGEDFTFNIKMDGDYVIKGLKIKHGYNHSGEQYINDNRQWVEETMLLSHDGEVTIPARYIDGDVAVEILFGNKPDGDGQYPTMKRMYNTVNQQNRYLREVVATVDGETQTIFTASTKEDLPYTKYENGSWAISEAGALIDKTLIPITVPEGTTSFNMTFKPYTSQIDGYNQELVWSQQAYYIDLNKDYSFGGVVDGTNEVSEAAGTPSNTNNFGDAGGNTEKGWTRTITLPTGMKPGTYRMRVVYLEPGTSSHGEYESDWNETLFTTHECVIRSGISYDFDINIVGKAVEMFAVTWETPENGTLTVKNGAQTLNSGDEVEKDTEITIEAVANKGFELKEIKVNNSPVQAENGICKVTITGITTISATFDEVVSINNVQDSNVYYNSENQTLYTDSAKSIVICDLTGRIVLKARNKETVNLSNLAEGIYTAIIDNTELKFRK